MEVHELAVIVQKGFKDVARRFKEVGRRLDKIDIEVEGIYPELKGLSEAIHSVGERLDRHIAEHDARDEQIESLIRDLPR